MMKKLLFLTVLAGVMPLSMMAQDDLYFTPSSEPENSKVEAPAYYSGISKSNDEYNRRGQYRSYYQKIGEDSLGNDIIEFRTGDGKYSEPVRIDTVYPGAGVIYNDDKDFAYSRRMSRFDNYYDPFLYGSIWGPWRSGWYGWYDPFYADAYWGYGGYWGGYYGWGYPYYGYYGHYGWPYYGRYGWGGYWGPSYYSYRNGGNLHRGANGYVGRNFGRNSNIAYGNMNGNRRFGSSSGNATRSFGTSTAGARRFGSSSVYNNGNRNFGSSTPATRSGNYTRSYNSSPRSYSSGNSSFGGSRSFGGGSSSSFGGGGSRSFGGGGGSRSFGGHR